VERINATNRCDFGCSTADTGVALSVMAPLGPEYDYPVRERRIALPARIARKAEGAPAITNPTVPHRGASQAIARAHNVAPAIPNTWFQINKEAPRSV